MSDYATEAARNYSIKESHPTIDDPIAAINFAVGLPTDECRHFLVAWQSGAWAEIEDGYRHYLNQLPKQRARRTQTLPSKDRETSPPDIGEQP